MSAGEIETTVSKLFAGIAPEQGGWERCVKGAKITGLFLSTLAFGTCSVLRETLWHASNWKNLTHLANIYLPFGFGFSLGSLLTYLPSQRVVRQLRIEAWRLGIPLYFFLTQLYLNANSKEEERWITDVMLSLWGVQLATVIDAYANHYFNDVIAPGQGLYAIHDIDAGDPSEPQSTLNERKFSLLSDQQPIRNIKFLAMALFGGAMIGGSFIMEDSHTSFFLRNFGAFYLTQPCTILVWEKIERRGHFLEEAFQKILDNATTHQEAPTHLKVWRGLRNSLEIVLPFSIAACLRYPKEVWTMALAGGLHGIYDERFRFPFTHLPLTGIRSIRKRLFDRERGERCLALCWKIARMSAEAGALGYFGYLVFQEGNGVFNFAIGTFIASVGAGYVSTRLVNWNFQPLESSPLMQTLFFRTLYSPEVLGIDPLYIYYYTVNYPIPIGSGALSTITREQGVFAFLSWSGYGWAAGRDLATYDVERPVGPLFVSRWLFFSNTLLMIQVLTGRVN